ncbi:mechanosensitive ion channel [Fulvivirga sp. RKSG066]|uniref:mechanosensitive ion channel family protein n=1 Tax=Fulvivirga aurantia TaxID=2529383 RepID=UPI0012BB9EE5|nr:mechanosensitive ion channel domain-containing protein [Fulvivirga aurantia]MTI20865.1 mechanosensitive ion channel [Fulvivirga aurantia]
MEYLEKAKVFLATQGVEFGLMLLKAIVILVVGLWVIRFLSKYFNKFLEKRSFDDSLKPFLESMFYNILLILLLLTVLTSVGVEVTSFIAILGAAGLAIGLALQGTLANFAGGVIILTIKPFRVGDYIEGGGNSGTVREIQIFNTILITPDNKKVVIPNGELSNDSITNYSAEENRRVDMKFGIGYDDDLKKAKGILMEMLENDERVLKDPAPSVTVAELADSSVNFNVRPWVKLADYWSVYWDFQENVKLRFDEEGISIPFPQRDIHVFNEK